MKTNKNASVVSCPPCGENVAVATKRGAYKAFSLMSPSIGPADHFLRKGGRKNGFTLIELLVVVLIIGILAAVAVPQYQKAVEKAAVAEAFPVLKSVAQAAQSYYLANGTYPTKFSQLDVELPWKGTEKWRNATVMRDTRSNDKWSLQLYQESGFIPYIYLGRISGKYAGTGFGAPMKTGRISMCVEKRSEGYIFNGNPGDYCVKLFHTQTPPTTHNNGRYYTMP